MTPATHREQLIGMLCEAAEIEHCLMCTYMYAAFSLKQSTAEDVTAEELAAIQRWRLEIIRIGTDEMLHLALVNNMLIALGARPRYQRFNFPISGGLFPADVAVALAPFDEATLDHFVYLERPTGAADQDGERYQKSTYQRGIITDRLMAFADDYETVGELYETIEASFAQLISQCSETTTFLGPVSAQLTEADFRLKGLHSVASMDDIRSAVNLIRVQGEGSNAESAGSHYARFCAIRAEWQALKEARPAFMPARPAARNPVMRAPLTEDRLQILAEPASQLVDVANAAYGMMVRQLSLMSDEALCPAGMRRPTGDQALALMHVVTDIGTLLTTLPANTAYPGITAGMTFTVSRSALAFQSPDSAAAIIAERYDAIAARLHSLAMLTIANMEQHAPMLTRHGNALSGFAKTWHERATAMGATSPTPTAPNKAATTPPTPRESGGGAARGAKVDVAHGAQVDIRFDHSRCIHSRHCVLGEPNVFIANKPGEWIYPDHASPERIAIVAHNCPSGAITYERHDGAPGEMPPEVNVARLRENGPIAFHAALQIANAPADGCNTRATLCRCGQSQNKPFCDGAHNAAGFVASGEPLTETSEPLQSRDGILAVTPLRNGPLEVNGNLEICTGTGRTINRLTSVRLCRCGGSANKPYCDGTHAINQFTAEGA
jgi:CDGSH-type Zn-finger protein/uncharacterized Fe-S cluster protein YjdI